MSLLECNAPFGSLTDSPNHSEVDDHQIPTLAENFERMDEDFLIKDYQICYRIQDHGALKMPTFLLLVNGNVVTRANKPDYRNYIELSFFELANCGIKCIRYDSNGNVLWFIDGEYLTNPMDVAETSAGHFLITDTGNEEYDGTVLKFSENGSFIRCVVYNIRFPLGIDTDSGGDIYVCDVKDNCVFVFSELGFLKNVISIVNNPIFVTVRNNSDLFISQANGIVCCMKNGFLKWQMPSGFKWKPERLRCDCIRWYTPRTIHHLPLIFIGHQSSSEEHPDDCRDKLVNSKHIKRAVFHPQSISKSERLAKKLDYLNLDKSELSEQVQCHFLDMICDKRLSNKFDSRNLLHASISLRGTNHIRKKKLITKQENIAIQNLLNRFPEDQTIINNLLLFIVKTAKDNVETCYNLKMTFSKKCDINFSDTKGNTALHLAVLKGNVIIVRILLKQGADPGLKNVDGLTCVDLSVLYNHSEITKALAWHISRLFFESRVKHFTYLDIWPGYVPEILETFQSHKSLFRTKDKLEIPKGNKKLELSYILDVCRCEELIFDMSCLEDNGIRLVALYDKLRNGGEHRHSGISKGKHMHNGILNDINPCFLKVYWRSIHKVSPEASYVSEILLSRKENHYSRINNSKLKLSGSVAKKLFQDHSQLTIISPSPAVSKDFSYDHKIILKPCIVFSCRVKGLIPIGEGLFPKSINGICTDVREGYCTFAHGGPHDYHQNVKNGCSCGVKIGTDFDINGAEERWISGTIGGFVEDSGQTCFITCAHVLNELSFMIRGNAAMKFAKNKIVWQPSQNTDPNNAPQKVGRVLRSFFNPDIDYEVSVDAALVVIDNDRHPINGTIPVETQEKLNYAGYDYRDPPSFDSGKILIVEDEHMRNDVIKYGAETGLTKGSLNYEGTHVRIENKELKVFDTSFGTCIEKSFQMFYQREVLKVGNRNFFDIGDSGAFVYMIMNNDSHDLRCIGMAIGLTTYGSCIMTPIKSVLSSLGVNPKLKKFVSGRATNFIFTGQTQQSNQPTSIQSDTAPLPQTNTDQDQIIPNIHAENSLLLNSESSDIHPTAYSVETIKKELNEQFELKLTRIQQELEQNFAKQFENQKQEIGKCVESSMNKMLEILTKTPVKDKTKLGRGDKEIKDLRNTIQVENLELLDAKTEHKTAESANLNSVIPDKKINVSASNDEDSNFYSSNAVSGMLMTARRQSVQQQTVPSNLKHNGTILCSNCGAPIIKGQKLRHCSQCQSLFHRHCCSDYYMQGLQHDKWICFSCYQAKYKPNWQKEYP